MKRKLLIVISLLLAGLFASAQNVTVVTADVSSVLPSTYLSVGSVRNWTGTNYTLSMAGGGGALAFVAIDHSDFVTGAAAPLFPIHMADVPSPINGINAFCIVGD